MQMSLPDTSSSSWYKYCRKRQMSTTILYSQVQKKQSSHSAGCDFIAFTNNNKSQIQNQTVFTTDSTSRSSSLLSSKDWCCRKNTKRLVVNTKTLSFDHDRYMQTVYRTVSFILLFALALMRDVWSKLCWLLILISGANSYLYLILNDNANATQHSVVTCNQGAE